MVQDEKIVFTEDEINQIIADNKKNLQSLARKFFYFTYLNKADLLQEGKMRILRILRRYENGEISVPRDELGAYIGRSLVNFYINLVQKYPAEEFFNPDRFSYTRLNDAIEFDDVIPFCTMLDILDEKETRIAIMLVCGYKQKEIAEHLHVSVRVISKQVKIIREKLSYLKEHQ